MKFIYKCRRCGQIDSHLGVLGNKKEDYQYAFECLLKAIHDTPGIVMMNSIHHCKDNPLAAGVSDLIGFEPHSYDPQS